MEMTFICNNTVDMNKADNTKIGESGLLQKINGLKLSELHDKFGGRCFFVLPRGLAGSPDLRDDEGCTVIAHPGDKQETKYKTGNVMGFIGYAGDALTITSPFVSAVDKKKNEDLYLIDERPAQLNGFGADWFLQYLLQRVLGLRLDLVDLSINADVETRIFQLMVLLFPNFLHQAMLKGPFSTYIRHQHNDLAVRGPIDVDRQIISNIGRRDRLAYSSYDPSPDNMMNQLVRHTIEMIPRLYPERGLGRGVLGDLRIRKDIRAIRRATDATYNPYDWVKVVEYNRRNPFKHPYYSEYADLQKLCLAIIDRQSIAAKGHANDMYGILFDGAWLWEEYVGKVLGSQFWHPKNRLKGHAGSGEQMLLRRMDKDRDASKACVGQIFPDFVTADGNFVLDAKFKVTTGISGNDYKQVLTYMFRFGTSRGYYLHPLRNDGKLNDDENELIEYRLLKGVDGHDFTRELFDVDQTQDVTVYKIGLNIPSEDCSYPQFSKQMGKNEDRMRKLIQHPES
ncbi:hypothetical protein [Bifidobacterium sp. ESL0732]|uniref:5-methylcytosine restriction system specificity protein McrC n=1 Tax=Bifidobacterium sp. ESL0732 TaxID=2983222 RepID=UPI0023F72076|nr:hypothetical protein [Bifidobacterium sp. ESL0732]WEV64114.1 hypothetical protein OZX70_00490 [Bifidobacterium sp. ESL0732]